MPEVNPPQGETATTEAASVETNIGENTQDRRFTNEEVDELLEKARAKTAYQVRKELEKKHSDTTVKPSKGSANVEEELRGKLTQYEESQKTLSAKLNKYRDTTLRASIERELNAQSCVDPEVVIDHFLARNKVELDDDDNVVVNNATGKLSDLVTDYLTKKPHLAKPSQMSGAGTKGPKAAPQSSTTFGDKSIEEMEAALGIDRSQFKRIR
jgi:hypothetical protein